ncbi:hypothetical protein SLEP1_g51296 [Rubroshorea leprosula]|uniref:Uncharacterized protein n=1 Tax=Rubroshorea leprosula TaxID=152421 RepID=A0AAV5M3H5_9ROSI|nr:hypothetical protein SLEP1_g51296 [Rubroshorea leprosula]
MRRGQRWKRVCGLGWKMRRGEAESVICHLIVVGVSFSCIFC